MKKNKKDFADKARQVVDGKIRRAMMDRITKGFRGLTTERLVLVADYVNSLIEVDEETLRVAEEQSIQICGYNPKEHMSDHDWNVMQKRNEEALKIEEEDSII